VTIPRIPPEYDQRTYVAIIGALEKRLNSIQQTVGAYTVTNPVPNRSIDVSSVSHAELAEIVGTIIQDLKVKGILG
jgi:hypothetical protein